MKPNGQISISTIFSMIVLLIVMGVWIQIWIPLSQNLIYSQLDNVAYGSVIKVMWDIVPLILFALVILFPYFQSRATSYPQQ